MVFTNSTATQVRNAIVNSTEKTAAFGVFKLWLSYVQSLSGYPSGQQVDKVFGVLLISGCNTYNMVKASTLLKVYKHWFKGLSSSSTSSIFMEKGVDRIVEHLETLGSQDDEQLEFGLEQASAALLRVVGSGASMRRRIRSFHYWLCLNLRSKVLFVTEKGYLGLAPASVAAGDHVMLLSGLRTPFLARPPLGGRDPALLNLVSPTSIAGMMEGELWTESDIQNEFMFV
jgi:hypothetical protein